MLSEASYQALGGGIKINHLRMFLHFHSEVQII